jgi:type IV pilus assembly protein PilQ
MSVLLVLAFQARAFAQTFAPNDDTGQAGTRRGSGTAVSQAQQAAPAGGGGGINAGTLVFDPSGLNANKQYYGEKISLDFQNADIHNILRLIGEVSGNNVVVSDQVQGKVTLKLKDVPWDQALDIVLASKNLGMQQIGNVIRIDTNANIRSMTPDYSDPNIRVPLIKKIFTPKYASVSALATEMEKVKSIRGNVRVIGNDIYVEDDDQAMEALTAIFARNDKVTKQILIEGRIVEASTRFIQQLGIRWGAGYDHIIGGGSNVDRLNTLPRSSNFQDEFSAGELYGAVTQIGGTASLGVGFLNRAGTMLLNAELNANESLNETRTVAAPRIMAANDTEVYIKQGQQIPYTTGGTTAGTTASTEFKDAALELRVTPHIEENGEIVTLTISLTKDSIAPASESGEILIDNKEAETKLMVKNGETVVIGGIITDEQSTINNRVPGLHAIPLLGWLFQEKNIQNEKRELLVFITANIIPITI